MLTAVKVNIPDIAMTECNSFINAKNLPDLQCFLIVFQSIVIIAHFLVTNAYVIINISHLFSAFRIRDNLRRLDIPIQRLVIIAFHHANAT
ncbi:hypothetical protein ES703_48571 [subsurface metagenome]